MCEDFVALLDESLLPNLETLEEKVFYLKMKGDNYDDLVGASSGGFFGNGPKWIAAAKQAYSDAMSAAESGMKPTDILKLELALKYSIFIKEVMHDKTGATKLLKRAWDDAAENEDEVGDYEFKDWARIMIQIREKLEEW